ncbi:MAG: HAMP domain-containing sensor histidine kinase [Bacteroidota bacterium]
MKANPISEIDTRIKKPYLAREKAPLEAGATSLDAMTLQIIHDLKDPLFGLSYLAELLVAGDISSEEQADFGHAIHKTVRKMKRLVDSLLSASHEDTPLSVKLVDPARVIDDVLKGFSLQIREKQATVELPAMFPRITVNEAWLYMIFRNLISNALKYGGKPLQIRIRLDYELSGYVRFWVEDNGKGIAETELPYLFSPFYRSNSAKQDGHGLGLSFVKKMVEKMGGEVGVCSPKGDGARFYFTLPIH